MAGDSEIVTLDQFVVPGGRVNDLFVSGSLGVYRSFGGSRTEQRPVITLPDNRTFTQQTNDVMGAARIRDSLLKKKGKVSFQRLMRAVRLGIDVDQLAKHDRDAARDQFNAVVRMGLIGLLDHEGELAAFAPSIGRGIWNSIKDLADIPHAISAYFGFQLSYATIRNYEGIDEAELFRETIQYRRATPFLTPQGRAEGIYGGFAIPVFLRGAMLSRAMAAGFAEGIAAESVVPRTIREIVSNAHPDSMIHLTPAPAGSFASGVESGTYWARLGDVSHMTVPEFQAGVVGPGAAASLGKPVSGFVVGAPGRGSFMWEGAFNAAGVMEHTNSGLLTSIKYVPIW